MTSPGVVDVVHNEGFAILAEWPKVVVRGHPHRRTPDAADAGAPAQPHRACRRGRPTNEGPHDVQVISEGPRSSPSDEHRTGLLGPRAFFAGACIRPARLRRQVPAVAVRRRRRPAFHAHAGRGLASRTIGRLWFRPSAGLCQTAKQGFEHLPRMTGRAPFGTLTSSSLNDPAQERPLAPSSKNSGPVEKARAPTGIELIKCAQRARPKAASATHLTS